MTVSKAIQAMTTSVNLTHESSPSPKRFISIYDSFLLIASTPGFNIEIFSEAWNVRSPSLSLMLYADEETDQPKDPFLWLQKDPVGRTLMPSEAIRYGLAIYFAGVLAEEMSDWMGHQSEVTEADLFEWVTDHLGSEITPEQLAQIRHIGTKAGITTTLYWNPRGHSKDPNACS